MLFDLDGTLIDSAPDLGAAADKMRTDRGLPAFPLDDYRAMAGAGARGMLRVAFGMSTDDPKFGEMREEFFKNYEARLTELTVVFPGVTEMLAGIEAMGIPWGVVTNKSERFALPLSKQMPLFERCAVLIGGDTTPHSKPHPAPLLEAARRLGVPAESCIYVGDDERDILAGAAANMRTVAADYGYLGDRSDTSQWNADAQIKSPLELLQLLSAA